MTVLEFDHVTVQVGAHRLLDDVTLRLIESEFVAVVGPNGAGKTTLIRVALGVIRPSSGRVLVDGEPLSALSGRGRAAKLGWLPQRGVILEPIPAVDFVAAARFRFRESRGRSLTAAQEALASVGAATLAGRLITDISGGELQRVLVAALLAQETPLVLLDEPANHLDPAQQFELYGQLVRLWRSGQSVLCVTHDVNALAYSVHHGEVNRLNVVGMKNGRIEFVTSYGAADFGALLGALFGVRMRAVDVGGRRLFVVEPPDAASLA
ncbi:MULTISPECIES: ABC transporter ATP-binding protein [Sorangium]|uniref:Fe(3+) dicitrate transport ATP-binding protein n=1 Tax=Sorangium cellulosum TaxID=56 RepID=A0A4P2R0F1_SORCE|nr:MULTISPECIES: ABC transporter ATP-binding protein [Sorangium]AUX36315.1 Fe(3+) dicitrate transport ATP-binding protein [Sorangium cellulosum]WCQ95614.1 ABC transporter [Sorangium sp. Soce836]